MMQRSHGQGPSNIVSVPSHAPYPANRNYRKVFVTIIHWEIDQLQPLVKRVIDVVQALHRYELREISLALPVLTLEYQRQKALWWPCVDPSTLDEKDLQFIIYLGGTTTNPMTSGFPNIRAVPFSRSDKNDEQQFATGNWLENQIGISPLHSDVLLVLGCYIEGLSDILAERGEIPILLEDDYVWARYKAILAGYAQRPDTPGKLSTHLVSVLQDLTLSNTFYAKEGHITIKYVMDKVAKNLRLDTDIDPETFGNDGGEDIILVPIKEELSGPAGAVNTAH